MNIVHRSGHGYVVWEIQRQACRPCLVGWNNGTLLRPKDGGAVCTHGPGMWQAGQVGPRGGWHGIGPRYQAERAAVLLCDALADAADVPPQGRTGAAR